MHRALLDAARRTAVVSLGSLGALHVLWATGSAWPAADRRTLADAVGGFGDFPGPGACLTVAALLGLAACATAGIPRRWARLARFGSAGTSVVLLFRAAVGLAGRMPNAKRSRAFAELDRRVYSPVSLAVGTLAIAGALPHPER